MLALKSGRLLCGFRAAPKKLAQEGTRSMYCVSDDGGRSWSQPRVPFAPPLIDGRPGVTRHFYMTQLTGGRLLAALDWVDYATPGLSYFNEDTQGVLDTRILLTWSDDEGESWSQPSPAEIMGANFPTPCTGPVLELQDGSLLLQFEICKSYFDTKPWRHSAAISVSGDQGSRWGRYRRVTDYPALYCWDQQLAAMSDGGLLGFFWTFDRTAGSCINIHASRSPGIGKRFGHVWDTGLSGQPGSVVELPDRSLAVIFIERETRPVIRIAVSQNGGRSFSVLPEPVYEGESPVNLRNADYEVHSSRFMAGHPRLLKLPDGSLMAYYYAGRHIDATNIHWVRLEL